MNKAESVRGFSSLLYAAVLITGSSIASEPSELDPTRPGAAPPILVQKLDPVRGTVTTYQASGIEEKLKPGNINALPETERNAAIKSFLESVTVPRNVVDEKTAERVSMPASELDPQSSTPAWGWRWRWGGGYGGYRGYGGYSGYGGYGYYGSGFYGNNYGYSSSYYSPYWGYNSYSGYYSGYPYYGYSSSYYPYYSYSYPYYSVYSYW